MRESRGLAPAWTPDIAARARGSLTAAVTETDRLARMVEHLLAMARLEEHAAIPTTVDLGGVCAERHRTWQPLFAREGVSLVLFAGSAGPVLAVPGAVEQIMDNLLSNALRASPAGSTVTVELRLQAPPRRALRDSRPRWVDVHVTDEGSRSRSRPGAAPRPRRRRRGGAACGGDRRSRRGDPAAVRATAGRGRLRARRRPPEEAETGGPGAAGVGLTPVGHKRHRPDRQGQRHRCDFT